MIGDQICHAQPGNIEGGGIVACPIPQAPGIATAEPRRPVICLFPMLGSRRQVGLCRLVTTRTGMGGATSLDIPTANPQHITLVAQDAPEFTSHLRGVAPVAEA